MSGPDYRPYQREAIRKLKNGNILCGGVGTGKSRTALGYFYEVECKAVQWSDGVSRGPMEDPKPLYIITTARKRDTHEWEKECEIFQMDVPITIDSWNNLHKYETVTDAFFIFDEQRVTGKGAWVKSFWRVTKANHWILLSATPGDTWADYMPVFVANGFYRNKSAFFNRHAIYSPFITKYPKIEGWREITLLEKLRRSITVVMDGDIRKLEKHWTDVKVEYDRQMYKRIAVDRWDIFKDEPLQDIGGACYVMRKAVNSDGRRLEAVRQILADHPRAIIFYNYDYELELLRTLAEEKGRAYGEWNGHQHDPVPSGRKWVYVVQYAAGAEGWNCITTDTLIFYSQSYSYKQMTQAAGRIDRMNTPFTDLYYFVLKSRAPIDIAIERALSGKKSFNEKLFAGQIHLNLPMKAS